MRIVYRAAAVEEVREAFAWYLKEAGQRQAQRFRYELNGRQALLVAHLRIWKARSFRLRCLS